MGRLGWCSMVIAKIAVCMTTIRECLDVPYAGWFEIQRLFYLKIQQVLLRHFPIVFVSEKSDDLMTIEQMDQQECQNEKFPRRRSFYKILALSKSLVIKIKIRFLIFHNQESTTKHDEDLYPNFPRCAVCCSYLWICHIHSRASFDRGPAMSQHCDDSLP